MRLVTLVDGLARLDEALKRKVSGTVNLGHTLRNWLFGFYIVEYEQNGEDRAKYGDQILEKISEGLRGKVNGTSVTNLRLFRQFYQTYPQIGQTLSDELANKLVVTSSVQLISRLSFSHFVELMKIDQPLKRAFYEIEAIKGTWGVRKLEDQTKNTIMQTVSAQSENIMI